MSQDPTHSLTTPDGGIPGDTGDAAAAAYRDDGRPDVDEGAKPNRGGRPSLSGHGGRSPQVGVRLPVDLRDCLAARAARDGVPESVIVRRALEAFFSA